MMKLTRMWIRMWIWRLLATHLVTNNNSLDKLTPKAEIVYFVPPPKKTQFQLLWQETAQKKTLETIQHTNPQLPGPFLTWLHKKSWHMLTWYPQRNCDRCWGKNGTNHNKTEFHSLPPRKKKKSTTKYNIRLASTVRSLVQVHPSIRPPWDVIRKQRKQYLSHDFCCCCSCSFGSISMIAWLVK